MPNDLAVLTNDISLHEMETIQVVDSLLGIVGTLVHDIGSTFSLEIGRIAYPDLSYRSILSE